MVHIRSTSVSAVCHKSGGIVLEEGGGQVADALHARAARVRELVDFDILLAVVGADAHPHEPEDAHPDHRHRDGHPMLLVPAIEHLEDREDGEHDRLAEPREEPGDAP